MQLLFATITFIVIFTTLYSYGQVISKNIYNNKFEDIFFKILIGYTFIGTLTLVVHFFFKINNLISFLIVALAIIFFVLSVDPLVTNRYEILFFG